MAGRGAVSAFADHCEWAGSNANDRENWLISRRSGVGGSDVAALMGEHPYKSALEVYTDKIATTPPTDDESEVAEWGRLFEPLIIKRFARVSGRRVVRGGQLLRSKLAPYYLITLDGVQLTKPPPGCRGPGIAEVKTTGFGNDYAADPDDAELDYEERVRVPVHVQIQMQWQMLVTGAEWATCIWLPFPERRMQWQDIKPHRPFQEVLARKVDEFWARVQSRVPPNPDHSESATRALYKLYPGQTDEVIRIRNACGVSDEYERNKAAIELLKSRNRFIRNVLAATMGEARHAVLDDGRYWGASFYAEKDVTCRHCSGLLSHKSSYRTFTLRAPKKKPHIVTGGTRELAVALDDATLTKQLGESLVGAPAPSNDDREGAAE